MTDAKNSDNEASTELSVTALPTEIDSQVLTAQARPRSIVTFKRTAETLATQDEDTAASCFYVLPRDGKNIEGPSARFAEIICSAYKNLRCEGKPLAEEEDFVVSRGTAWDMENNVLVAFEVKRRIKDKYGRRYGADMIMTTQNAATAIALRNAQLKVIPKPFWAPIYEQCRKVVKGSITTLADRRRKSLDSFQKLGVSNARVFDRLEVKGEDDITVDHLVTLRGYYTAIKDEGHSVDEIFPEPKKQSPSVRKSEAQSSAADNNKESSPPSESQKRRGRKAQPEREQPEQAATDAKQNEEDSQIAQRLEALRQYINETSDEDFLSVTHADISAMTKGLPVKDLGDLLLQYSNRKQSLLAASKGS